MYFVILELIQSETAVAQRGSERLGTCPHAVDGGPLGGPASLCPEKGCNLLKGAQLSKLRLGPELPKFANIRLPAVYGESAQGQEGRSQVLFARNPTLSSYSLPPPSPILSLL